MGSMTAHLNISTYSISTSIKCMLSVADFLSYTKAFEFFLLAKHDALIGCWCTLICFLFLCVQETNIHIFEKKMFQPFLLSNHETVNWYSQQDSCTIYQEISSCY